MSFDTIAEERGRVVLGKRARSIILEIIKKGEVRIQDLAGKYRVSERTIRSDLEEIDYFLKEHRCDRMERRGKGVVSICGGGSVAMLIYRLINESRVVTASYSPDERLLELFYRLAMAGEPVRLTDLAEELLVSKSTVVKDMERLKAMYLPQGLRFVGNHEGMELLGEEEGIRRQLVKRFIETMDKHAVMDLTNRIMHEERITYKVFWRLFEGVDLELVRGCIEFLKVGLGAQLSDREYLNLMGHFCILLKRAALGRHPAARKMSGGSPWGAFLCGQLYRYLEEAVGLNPAERPYLYYVVCLASAPLYLWENPLPEEEAGREIRACLEAFGCVGNAYVESGLWQEYRLLYWERQLGIPGSPPMVELEEGAFARVYAKLEPLLADRSRDERWRIAAHFMAGTELSGQTGHKRVLVVSDKPSSFIRLLIDQIVPMFDIEIVGVTGLAQLSKYRRTLPVDCILSTIHLQLEDIEVVEVHLLLNLEAVGILEQHFFPRKALLERPSAADDAWLDREIVWATDETKYRPSEVAAVLAQLLLSQGGCSLSLERSIEDTMQKQRFALRIGRTQILNNRNYLTVKKNRVVGCRIRGEGPAEAVILISVESPELYLEVVSGLLQEGSYERSDCEGHDFFASKLCLAGGGVSFFGRTADSG